MRALGIPWLLFTLAATVSLQAQQPDCGIPAARFARAVEILSTSSDPAAARLLRVAHRRER